MKILHLNSEQSWRGGEQQMANLALELKKQGHTNIIAARFDSKSIQFAKENNFEERIFGHEIDLLSEKPVMPKGADAIWMSQFLDCFSKPEIIKILSAAKEAMGKNTKLHIMETYTDRQDFENASFCLRGTSLYFTAMANGNSKMYRAGEMYECIMKAGLKVEEDIDNVGEFHTILTCVKA